MQTRRKFLELATLGGSAIALNPKNVVLKNNNNSTKPIVVSTWNFGIRANKEAWTVLKSNGSALDAAEAGARLVEADPSIQTIGLGGFPDRDGYVTLDACVMDEKGNAGAVGCMQDIVHAVSVAKHVKNDTPHVMLVGEGATQFALSKGFKRQNLLTPESKKAWKEWLKKSDYKPEMNIENKSYLDSATAFNPLKMPGGRYNHDTIGILAIDQEGNLSGACTTSGMAFKMHGRVGDSPIIGAGLYVDNKVGAATATGVGEANMRMCGTHTVVEYMRHGHSPEDACRKAVERVVKHDYDYAKRIQLGFLAINKKGETGAYCLQKGFNYAVYSEEIPNKLFDGKYYF
ncbi:MAG TPA: N(4)-(beta-N-acetylglucosaminyl)-L-asparaginase [Chitinophagaceae bacterium]|nr:N(4)-(beta-N-acetylglucosaminyl)-L-asparaginase [Chitinophagaceae bacterium]